MDSKSYQVEQPSDRILAIILGEEQGDQLFPLTKFRAKSVIPFAGYYKLIDIPISNCIHSDIYHIAVLTQFCSLSVYRHISSVFNSIAIGKGWVQTWAAEQNIQSNEWFLGSADAVRKHMQEVESFQPDKVLIIPGGQIYRMDFKELITFHNNNQSDITICVHPIKRDDTMRYGITKSDPSGRIIEFAEKMTFSNYMERLVSNLDREKPFHGSMGIYLIEMDILRKIINTTKHNDFEIEVLPEAIKNFNVFTYRFQEYWEDFSSIRDYYEASLRNCSSEAPFQLGDPGKPIFRQKQIIPCSSIRSSNLYHVLLADGCMIQNANIINSVIGPGTMVSENVYIQDCVILGAGKDMDSGSFTTKILSKVIIGRNSEINGAILDENCTIGENVTIRPFPTGTNLQKTGYSVLDGIIVIHKGTVIPDHSWIGPQTDDLKSERYLKIDDSADVNPQKE
ncbi:MAG: glucose-1-phosphate adenylyltransferase [Anaerolineaceae bacterium]|nr:glucose-1-phosphate adenylyltransferase [Anaerolineaceae bacterium]